MATNGKKVARTKRPASGERAVVYHGIRIAPVTGKRSPVAQAIRDALQSKSEQLRGESAPT